MVASSLDFLFALSVPNWTHLEKLVTWTHLDAGGKKYSPEKSWPKDHREGNPARQELVLDSLLHPSQKALPASIPAAQAEP